MLENDFVKQGSGFVKCRLKIFAHLGNSFYLCS